MTTLINNVLNMLSPSRTNKQDEIPKGNELQRTPTSKPKAQDEEEKIEDRANTSSGNESSQHESSDEESESEVELGDAIYRLYTSLKWHEAKGKSRRGFHQEEYDRWCKKNPREYSRLRLEGLDYTTIGGVMYHYLEKHPDDEMNDLFEWENRYNSQWMADLISFHKARENFR